MKTVNGNILDATEKVIIHQINAVTRKSHGLSTQIFNKFEYADVYTGRPVQPDFNLVGKIIVREHAVDKNLPIIIGIVGQRMPGRLGMTYNYKGFTTPPLETAKMRQDWFQSGLNELKKFVNDKNINQIAVPYKIGCGLAGGNWTIYEKMLQNFEEESKCEVVIYNLGDN